MQVLQGLVQRVLSNMTPKGGPGSENNIKYDTLEGGATVVLESDFTDILHVRLKLLLFLKFQICKFAKIRLIS